MPQVRRILPVLVLLTLLGGLLGAVPAAQAARPTELAAVPDQILGIEHCIPSSQPGGYPLCGYHKDGPWLFQSGRTVTCWAGLQYQPNVPDPGDYTFRVWHKCHAVGVHGTVVSSTVRWEDIRRVHWYCPNGNCGSRGTVATACGSGCTKTGLDVTWTGTWQVFGDAALDWGRSTDAHVVVHINNTNDTTSDHCVSSYKWTPRWEDDVPVC